MDRESPKQFWPSLHRSGPPRPRGGVELYDLDHTGYSDADLEPDSFVRPDALVLESKTVPAPAGRVATWKTICLFDNE